MHDSNDSFQTAVYSKKTRSAAVRTQSFASIVTWDESREGARYVIEKTRSCAMLVMTSCEEHIPPLVARKALGKL